MTIKDAEYKSFVGVSDVYIARVTRDDAGGYETDTPQYFAPVAELGSSVEQSTEVQYADNAPYDSISGEGGTTLSLKVTGIPAELYALITGKKFDATVGRVFDTNSTPPDFALGFKGEKTNGAEVYFWFLKGKFAIPNQSLQTKTASPTAQTAEITYTSVFTVHKFTIDGMAKRLKKVNGDEDTVNFDPTGWFNQVQTYSTVAPSSLALSSSSPVDGTTGVAVGSNITLTFNNALPDSAIANVVLVKSDGTAVACTNSLDTTKKIMTINPDSNLDASSTYIVAIGVTDIYGDTLTAAVNFVTA